MNKDKMSTKIKRMLGICTHVKCFKKAMYDIEIPIVSHKGCLCEEHFNELSKTNIFNMKAIVNNKEFLGIQ